ncbi:MAG TPA: S-methyl-5-thioribose-1-phosphate isomerase [Sulfolobales archaeon]|nr:S-methyl-5-thioribose-1-phosphate isomerase [Sulfolobales archaeon]
MDILMPVRFENGKLVWLDVTRLPYEEVWVSSDDIERIARAIERLEIRGAPAIGVAAALALAVVASKSTGSRDDLLRSLEAASQRLSRTRPTAVNLFWALKRVMNGVYGLIGRGASVEEIRSFVIQEALRIQKEDLEANMMIGKHGQELIEDGDVILTHCNTGSLATSGFGTALGVIRYAWIQGKRIRVIATETRPLLQGARLTVWELMRDGIPVKLVTDNAVGYLMYRGMVSKVIVGADRILKTGHVANKIGTYMIALAAKRHGIPFYVAAPTSTIDPETRAEDLVIEERNPEEVKNILGRLLITRQDAEAINPAFDITPPDLVSAIITEKGIARPPYEKSLQEILKS